MVWTILAKIPLAPPPRSLDSSQHDDASAVSSTNQPLDRNTVQAGAAPEPLSSAQPSQRAREPPTSNLPEGTHASRRTTGSFSGPAAQAASVPKEAGLSISVPTKKKAKMGPEELKVRNQTNTQKHHSLMEAINAATVEYEARLEEIANANNIKVQRVKQLALHAPPITRKRKVSDWNIMVHFKGKELNDGEFANVRWPVLISRLQLFLRFGFQSLHARGDS